MFYYATGRINGEPNTDVGFVSLDGADWITVKPGKFTIDDELAVVDLISGNAPTLPMRMTTGFAARFLGLDVSTIKEVF